MINKLMTADQLFDCGGEFGAGFNRRVHGHNYDEACGYPNYRSPDRDAGWNNADELIRKGEIYCVHRFAHIGNGGLCKGFAFPYGGTYVCNDCGKSHLDKPWWSVRVFKDGSAWCVVGEDFENLQESENYAFGDTKEEALENYRLLMEQPTDTDDGRG